MALIFKECEMKVSFSVFTALFLFAELTRRQFTTGDANLRFDGTAKDSDDKFMSIRVTNQLCGFPLFLMGMLVVKESTKYSLSSTHKLFFSKKAQFT